MTFNYSVVGLATATALAITVAYTGTLPSPSVATNEFVRIAHSSPKAGADRVYCYNGLKSDAIDKWAPNYRGWICVPENPHRSH